MLSPQPKVGLRNLRLAVETGETLLNAEPKQREIAERLDSSGPIGAQTSRFLMDQLETPLKSFGGLDAESVANLITAAADVALVVDKKGVIRDVSCGNDEFALESCKHWVGRPWADTVTSETKPKIEALLRDAGARVEHKWRQVNHPFSKGPDVPFLYSAVQVGSEGRVVAFGRDLRANAALQQRLVDAQQSMERDYWRLRHVETRYRLLFQLASEAVLVLDATTLKVVEANPAVGKLLGRAAEKFVGRVFPDGFDEQGTLAIQDLFAKVRTAVVADEVRAKMAESGLEFSISASLFRQERSSSLLVRLAPVLADVTGASVPTSILRIVENAPDGFVVADLDGKLLVANRAFIDLAQLTSEEQARGESLERWLGQSGVDFKVLLSNLHQHGSVRLFATTLRGEHGSTAEVEISAVAVPLAELPCLGFTIRNVGKRLGGRDVRASRELPRSVEQLTELVGRVSLKELVVETTDMIEKLCIEAALELTQDNRAAAAEMLGLSRQSLYVKLRRYGLGDLPADAAGADTRPN